MPVCILEAVEVVLGVVLNVPEVVLHMLDVLKVEAVLKVVLYMTEVVNGVRCVLWIMLCMLFCVLLRILEAVEARLCLLEELEAPEVMRCVLLCLLEGWRCRG